jgi:cephalosporin-C deacetylase
MLDRLQGALDGLTALLDRVVVAVPSFGWAEGRRFLVQEGSGQEINHYLEAHPEREEDLMLVLSYFDSMNFAADVRCPTLVGLGLEDNVVPAPTVYAIANHLGGPHEVVRLPVSHTERPEEKLWERYEAYWLRLAVRGVPRNFGGKRELSI